MMTLSTGQLASLLIEADDTHTPLDESYRQSGMTIGEAYEVQRQIRLQREAAGDRLIGYKIGFASRVMRATIGASSPDYGGIYQRRVLPLGTPIPASDFIFPRVEQEILFLMGEDLPGPAITPASVIAACRGILPAVEIVDRRWGFSGTTFADAIADNGSFGALVMGTTLYPLEGLDLRRIGVYTLQNGELIASGTAVEVMDDPVNAVCWLAGQLLAAGSMLRAGDVVLSGSVTAAIPAHAGDSFHIAYTALGDLDLKLI